MYTMIEEYILIIKKYISLSFSFFSFIVKGSATADSAGLIAAIADQVAKLEPKQPPPIISLQSENRYLKFFSVKGNKCLIRFRIKL